MLAVRLARENDRAAIAEISKQYNSNLVPLVYNSWQQQGTMYVAEIEGKVIGICGLVFPALTEAQILGIRLLPEHQKEQVGRDFIIALMQVAQEKGCNVVRLLTGHENYETQAALQRNLSFGRCGAWVIGYGEEITSPLPEGPGLAVAAVTELEDIWSYLQYSQNYRRSQGLVYTDLYAFRNFSKAYLSQQLVAGNVYAWQEDSGLAGVAIAEFASDTIILSYLDAKPHAVGRLLRGILGGHSARHLTTAVPLESYADAKPFLEELSRFHRPDQWLVMAREVTPLAMPRE